MHMHYAELCYYNQRDTRRIQDIHQIFSEARMFVACVRRQLELMTSLCYQLDWKMCWKSRYSTFLLLTLSPLTFTHFG